MPCHDALPCAFEAVLESNLFVTLPYDDDRLIDLSQMDWERSRNNIRSQQVRDPAMNIYREGASSRGGDCISLTPVSSGW
jgi:hypothetical protein